MSKEEITYKIPNNQIHISEIKDEDCLIWISPKALNMANTIDELQQENQKYKEVIDKLKNKTKENIENAKCEITTLTIGDEAYYQYIEKILDNYVDILKEVE